MPDPNLPDNWNAYWRTCSACGRRYHLSGTDDCDCQKCDRCGQMTPPDQWDSKRECCDECSPKVECPSCHDWYIPEDEDCCPHCGGGEEEAS